MQSVVTELRCEYRSNPLGIDAPAPRLSWIIQSDRRGERQTAYQILVASTPALLAADKGDLWDSGRIESEQSLNIPYAGQALTSNLVCHWKVRVWSALSGVEGSRGKASPWSETAFWTVGLLSENWRAKWITVQMPPTPAAPVDALKRESVSPWLRRTFTLEAVPERALVHVNAVGYFELHVNGEKVGTDVLSPAVSVLSKRTWVMSYDIAAQLRNGKNTIGLWLGRGWNAVGIPGVTDERPRVRLQAEIIADGVQIEIVSDQTWKAMPSSYVTLGPWAWNQYCGERYDARLDNPEWCRAELDDSAWPAVAVIPDAGVPADAQPCPANRIGKIIPAVRCLDIGNARYELDFGTNLTGRLKLRIPQLPSGSLVKLFYADWRYSTANPEDELTPAGVIKSSGSDMRFPGKDGELRYQVFNQVDEFISGGKDGEIFCSKFNYHGFRCVIVEGLSANPGPAVAVAEMIESDLEPAGSFACSNDLLNRIHGLNLWTVRCLNLGGYMVDCPHRERLGYGDGQVSIETAVMNLWMPNFYAKWALDWMDTQHPETGALPFSTPYHQPAGDGDFGREGPPA